MREFQHPHVLGLIGLAEKEPGIPYVILPYMDNGDLLTFVRDSSVVRKVLLKFEFSFLSVLRGGWVIFGLFFFGGRQHFYVGAEKSNNIRVRHG